MDRFSDPEIQRLRECLVATIRGYGRVAVAFSGGVDSAVVAAAAHEALGDAAVAVTGWSDSVAEGEVEEARELAGQIGIRHQVIRTHEFENPEYTRNAPDRCFHCKTELYTRLVSMRDELRVDVIASGSNQDDLGDYRPGLQAAAQQGVRNPLQECGLGKPAVRALAQGWGLPIWDKPATPCLSSRVAFGEEVTPDRVARIDRAEQWLKAQGLRELRVRHHAGDLARIEVPVAALALLTRLEVREELVRVFRSLGFKFVTIDLEGFRSGSLNSMVDVSALSAGLGSR